MRGWWVTLTNEVFPRLSVVRTPTADALGPFRSRTDATDAAATVAEFCGLRTCTTRIGKGQWHGPKCPPRDIGGCPAIADDEEGYRVAPETARALIRGEEDAPLRRARARIEELAAAELFESAARLRDRVAILGLALRRVQRLAALAAVDELVAARPAPEGGWEFAVIRAGRLASAGVSRRGVAPMPVVEALVASAETVLPDPVPLRGRLTRGARSHRALARRRRCADRPDQPRLVRARTRRGSWEDWCTLARTARAPTVSVERQHS